MLSPSHHLPKPRVLAVTMVALCFANYVVAQPQILPINTAGSAVARTKSALYIAGGLVDIVTRQISNQFYKLDLTVAWTSTNPAWKRLANGPSSALFAAAFSRDEKTMVTFQSAGGVAGGAFAWLYSVDSDAWTTSKIKVAAPDTQGVAAVTNPTTNLVYIPVSYSNNPGNWVDIYDFSSDSIRSIPLNSNDPNIPSGTYFPAVWSSYMKSVIYFGVHGVPEGPLPVTAYDPSRNSYTTLVTTGDLPPSRMDTCAAASDDGSIIVVYGGRPYTGQIHTLDLKTLQWKQRSEGLARMYHACALVGNNQFITWGGTDLNQTAGLGGHSLPVRVYNLDSDQWVNQYTPPASYIPGSPPTNNTGNNPTSPNNNTNNNTGDNTGTSLPDTKDKETNNVGLIAGASAGVGVVLIAAIVGVIFYRRRVRERERSIAQIQYPHANGDNDAKKPESTMMDDGEYYGKAPYPTPSRRESQKQGHSQQSVSDNLHLRSPQATFDNPAVMVGSRERRNPHAAVGYGIRK